MVNQAVDPSRTFEGVLVRQCAPTLAGIKPGSIFCFQDSSLEVSRQKACQWDERLTPLGLSVQILLERPDSGSVIVYVYRRDHLEQLLADRAYREFLRNAGYTGADLDGLLAQLTYRLQTQQEFPHEIGVFLGYPLQDVVGFIQNRGNNYTCSGLWKSYGDPSEAQAYFTCYKKCSCILCKLFEQGVPLEVLAVSA